MKTILITGANSEIASTYVKQCGSDYDLILTHYGHRRDRIDELIDIYGSKIVLLKADLFNRTDVENLISECYKYEINEFLHVAAPGLRHVRFIKGNFEEYELEMQVVFWSFLRICQCIMPEMIKKKCGRIVAILTEYTIMNQPPYLTHYISAKFALLGLIKCLANEYAAKGIRINGISPGMIETDFISKLPQYVIDNNAKENAKGRNLSPSDLVSTIKFLLSEEAISISGQNILLQ